MTECQPHTDELTEEEFTYQAPKEDSLSEAVIHAVSAFTGRKPVSANPTGTAGEELDLLFDTIDPDALDSLFQTAGDRESMVGTVEFFYCGCEVTVDSTGFVIVTKR